MVTIARQNFNIAKQKLDLISEEATQADKQRRLARTQEEIRLANKFNRDVNERFRKAKTNVIVAKEELQRSQGQETSRKRRIRQVRTIEVSVGGARNRIETRVESVGRKTRTTFRNRDTGTTIIVNRKTTFGNLTSTERKALTKPSFRPSAKRKVTKVTVNGKKRSIEKILKGVKIKGESLTSQAFTSSEIKQIQQAKDPKQAVKAIFALQKSKAKASKQKLDAFLKVTTKSELTRGDVTNINRAIDTEIKRQQNRGLQLKAATNKVTAAFKSLITSKGSIVKKVLSPTFTLKVGKEIGRIIFDIGKGSVNAIKGSFNYGRNLVRRGLWTRKNNPLANDIIKLSKGTTRVTSFIVNNPAESAMIVGIAVALGAAITLNTITNKPSKALAEAIFFLAPTRLLKAPVVVGKLTVSQTKKIVKVVNKLSKSKKAKLASKLNLKSLSITQKKKALFRELKNNKGFPKISEKDFLKLSLDDLRSIMQGTFVPVTKVRKIKKVKPKKKPVTFKVGTVKQRLLDKIKKAKAKRVAAKKKKPSLEAKRKADIVFKREVKQATTQARKGFKVGFAGKKGQIRTPRQLQQQVNKIKDRTENIIQNSYTLKRGDRVRFKIGNIQEVKSQSNIILKQTRALLRNKTITRLQAKKIRLSVLDNFLA